MGIWGLVHSANHGLRKKNPWCLLSWQWTKLTFDNKVKVHADAMEIFHFCLKWSSGYWEIDFKYQTFAEVVKGQVLSVRYFTLVCMPYLSSSNSGSLPYEYLILKIEGSLSKFADDITVSIPVHAEDSNIAESEVRSILKWAEKNQMTLNLNKTWKCY